jgi:hypothetical protein
MGPRQLAAFARLGWQPRLAFEAMAALPVS